MNYGCCGMSANPNHYDGKEAIVSNIKSEHRFHWSHLNEPYVGEVQIDAAKLQETF